MKEFFGTQMPKLGFGMMRLPRFEDKSFDIEQVKEMVDRFLAAGLKYVDTAYVYQGSEEVVKQALVDRYPRDSYYLATKLNAGNWAAANEEEAKKQLQTSLERTGAGYFDFYLLHALSKENIDNYEKYGIWEFVKEAKEKGLIRHYGFSFHDSAEVLEEVLTKHPDAEFVQLQINYADWDDPIVQSRKVYEVCVKHNKPVVVMEPVKGGTLANPPQQITDIFKEANPDASNASWAIHYVASLECACRHYPDQVHILPLLHKGLSDADQHPGYLRGHEQRSHLRPDGRCEETLSFRDQRRRQGFRMHPLPAV